MTSGILSSLETEEGRRKLAAMPSTTPEQRKRDDIEFAKWISSHAREDGEREYAQEKQAEFAQLWHNILDEDLQFELQRLNDGIAKNGIGAHKSRFRSFAEFCTAFECPALPTIPEAIAGYVICHSDAGVKELRAVVSAIKAVHRMYYQTNPRARLSDFESPIVRAALRWAERFPNTAEGREYLRELQLQQKENDNVKES